MICLQIEKMSFQLKLIYISDIFGTSMNVKVLDICFFSNLSRDIVVLSQSL